MREAASGQLKVYRNGSANCGAIDQAAFPKAASASASWAAAPERLCLLGGRFAVEVDWRNQ